MNFISFIRHYQQLEKHIVLFITAEFFLQLINSSFMTIMLIYMEKVGYQDHQSASFVSFRFLGVLLFAFPLGMFIKGRKLKPLFYISSILTPTLALLILETIDLKMDYLLRTFLFLWGVSFTGIQITALPYILRNAKPETHTAAITLSYSTWSFAGIISGVIIYILTNINPDYFNEKLILQLISLLGFCGILFIFNIKSKEHEDHYKNKMLKINDYDWLVIAKALVPTFIIAVGAGLTIPFIGLFFYKIHGIDSDQYAAISSVATLVVFCMVLFVPIIKEKLGYKLAVPLSQLIAVGALIVLALTEIMPFKYAAMLAILAYIVRQPLMNIAGPMTSDIVMKYVGEKNREMVSALTAAIWSGSWFVSSIIFQLLRKNGIQYVYVFLITAGLYLFGVLLYYFLILDYERKIKQGIIER